MAMTERATLELAEVQRVAKLAHLTLTASEAEGLVQDMSNILTYVQKLAELDTTDVVPTAHAVELPTKLRDDIVQPGLPLERAMLNAPERLGDGFGVPKIID